MAITQINGRPRPGIVPRDPAAPRLIEWTGERCVPWAPDPQVVYEHLHRYLWAAHMVAGMRVLDLASGEGFGAAILATTAASVLGVDVDPPSVEHSRIGYKAANLSFLAADARDLGALPDHEFDAVVAFEMIEHIDEHEQTLDEIRRVLRSNGLLMMSTPDRVRYARTVNEPNPFHVRELDRREFQSLLESRFGRVQVFGQRTVTGSAVSSLTNGTPPSTDMSAVYVEHDNGNWRLAGGMEPTYLLMLASDEHLPPSPSDSVLADCEVELLRWAQGSNGEQQRELERGRGALAAQELELARRRRRESLLQLRTATQLQHVKALEDVIDATVAENSAREASLDAEIERLSRRLMRVDESVIWQMFQRSRARTFARLGGENSRRVAALQATLRFVGRRFDVGGAGARTRLRAVAATRDASSGRAIQFPHVAVPKVSLVMPVHSNAPLTRAALESIVENTPFPEYEVIIVDDSDDVAIKALLARVVGARIVVNDERLGYAQSVSRGTALARGAWLVLCNNDIVVRPGWLDALVECGESSSDIAIVTPKYVYPDGRLAEAGGVIWRDGTGANYGRYGDPGSCHYNFRREVDYGSAAALLVRGDVWRALGGYDRRFDPMYYEDVDLCFRARGRGLRVMYEPRAVVVHDEGSTAGNDENASHKRHQRLNRPRFVEKWREQLEREHLENDQSRIWEAAIRTPGPQVLVVDHVVPSWDRDAGSLRMREILRALVELGAHVTFLADNMAPLQPYTGELQRLGVEVIYGVDPHELHKTIGPSLSLAILSRPHPAAHWLDTVREHAPQATVVYDTVDLHWLREARRAAAAVDSAELVFSEKALAIRELERAMMRATDATVAVTDIEATTIQRDVPGTTVHVLPIGNRIRAFVPPADERSGIVFVGGFGHPPNIDAAVLLARSVMPLVWRELPDVKLTIVGAGPPTEVMRLQSSLIEVAGWVDDLDPLLGSARALVAPLRYGAGLKGKVTQALAEGLPVVTTEIGAEGLDAVDGEHLLIGCAIEELAEKTIAVLNDDELWQRLSVAGQVLIADRGSPSVIAERLRDLLDQQPARR